MIGITEAILERSWAYMIEYSEGDLLQADVDALVNTINIAGVMGAGVALSFKQIYPDMFLEYHKACAAGELELGHMYLYHLGGLVGGPRFIINFPTKRHWGSNSKIEYITSGLKDLVRVIEYYSITSLAIPPLGCGNGGLRWSEVHPLILEAFAKLPEVRVVLFAPS